MTAFEPIPETREAADELSPDEDGAGGEWLGALLRLAERARELVPDLVGVSVARLQAGLAFTVVASDATIAVLDAVQYVDGGPCVDGAQALERRGLEADDPLDEERWRLFSLATAARAVRSTLTLPILAQDGSVRGSVNLYAGSGHAFGDVHEDLAEVFGAWAAGAVENADLSFRTLEEARRAPGLLRDQVVVDTAVGILISQLGVPEEAARRRLADAASRAGTSVVRLAREIIDATHPGGGHGQS